MPNAVLVIAMVRGFLEPGHNLSPFACRQLNPLRHCATLNLLCRITTATESSWQ